jgi:hypothetical protein
MILAFRLKFKVECCLYKEKTLPPPIFKTSVLSSTVALSIFGSVALLSGLCFVIPTCIKTEAALLLGSSKNVYVIGLAALFVGMTLLFILWIGIRDPYLELTKPSAERYFDEEALPNGLQIEKVFEEEFEYAANATQQAMEHRMAIVNFYLLIAGGVGSGVIALVGSGNRTISIAAVPLVWVISLVGILILLQLIALRRAWANSVMEMSYIKEFFIANARHFTKDSLKNAFFWGPLTVPSLHKPGSVFYYSMVMIALLNSTAFAGGSFLLGWNQGATLLDFPAIIFVIAYAYIFFHSHILIYNIMLIPRNKRT